MSEAQRSAEEGEEGVTLPEVFEYTDPKTKEVHTLPVAMQPLLNHASESARVAVTMKEKARYRELESLMGKKDVSMEELQANLRLIEEEKMTAEERAGAKFSRELDKANKLAVDGQELAAKNFNMYRDNKINNDLYGAFAGHELSNIEQAMLILKSQGGAKLVEADGKFSTVLEAIVDGEMVELSPKEAVERWVALPENSHFIKNNLRPGSGTSAAGGGMDANGTMRYKRSAMADPAVRKEYMEKQQKGEAVSIVDG